MAKPSTKPRAARAKRTETVRSARYHYTAIFEPAEEGGYVVTIPALNGLTTEGDTLAEARAMAEDAILGYLEALHKAGQPIPRERGAMLTRRLSITFAHA
jgi:antitoxin HicB